MDFKDLTNKIPNNQLKTMIITLIIVLFLLLRLGLNQTRGKASGPTHRNAITSV